MRRSTNRRGILQGSRRSRNYLSSTRFRLPAPDRQCCKLSLRAPYRRQTMRLEKISLYCSSTSMHQSYQTRNGYEYQSFGPIPLVLSSYNCGLTSPGGDIVPEIDTLRGANPLPSWCPCG